MKRDTHDNQSEDEAADTVFEDLHWPKVFLRVVTRIGGRNTMFSEHGDM